MAGYLLIRCTGVAAREQRLRDHLAPAFSGRVRFVVDGTADAAGPVPQDAIVMTPAWLAGRGLLGFARSGWRCGDYCYYAAAEGLADLDRAWLVDADLWPSFADPAAFFGPLADIPADLLAPRFSVRGGEWFWSFAVRAVLGEGPVHGCLFPITRLTRRAIDLCRAARVEGLARAAAEGPARTDAVPLPVPNDEGLVATTLARAGLDCRDLEAIMPGAFTAEGFSWDAPLMPQEALLPELSGQILHPVAEAAEARPKLALLAQRRPDRHAARRAQVVARLGEAAWRAWSGEA